MKAVAILKVKVVRLNVGHHRRAIVVDPDLVVVDITGTGADRVSIAIHRSVCAIQAVREAACPAMLVRSMEP